MKSSPSGFSYALRLCRVYSPPIPRNVHAAPQRVAWGRWTPAAAREQCPSSWSLGARCCRSSTGSPGPAASSSWGAWWLWWHTWQWWRWTRMVKEGAKGRDGEWRGGWGCYLGGMIWNREQKERNMLHRGNAIWPKIDLPSIIKKFLQWFRHECLMSECITLPCAAHRFKVRSMIPWNELFVAHRKQSNLCFQHPQFVWKKYRNMSSKSQQGQTKENCSLKNLHQQKITSSKTLQYWKWKVRSKNPLTMRAYQYRWH